MGRFHPLGYAMGLSAAWYPLQVLGVSVVDVTRGWLKVELLVICNSPCRKNPVPRCLHMRVWAPALGALPLEDVKC